LFSSNQEILSKEWNGKKGKSKYSKDYSRIVLGEKKKKKLYPPLAQFNTASSQLTNINAMISLRFYLIHFAGET